MAKAAMVDIGEYEIERDLKTKRQTTDGNGTEWVVTGREIVTIHVSLDESDLLGSFGMARRAANNKTGKSKDGPVVARVIGRRPA